MGFGSLLRKGSNLVKTASRVVGRVPGAKLIPGVGTALTIAGGVAGAASMLRGGGGGMPAMPMMGGGGMPATPQTQGGFNLPIPFWRGAGGKFQLPWNDPEQMFKPPFAYDDSVLKLVPKAPPGFVVVKDPQGRPYAMARFLAIRMHLYKPAKKPPISVRDWSHLQGANRVVKKLQDMEKKAKKIANWHKPRHAAAPAKKGK